MGYVDGFVLPLPNRRLPAYRKLSRQAGKIWLDHGALDYHECAGDDMKIKGAVSFCTLARCKRGEAVIFAWISYKSRAHRDRVNALVMKDPRLAKMITQPMPFDSRRMAYGGFISIVELSSTAKPSASRKKKAPVRKARKAAKS